MGKARHVASRAVSRLYLDEQMGTGNQDTRAEKPLWAKGSLLSPKLPGKLTQLPTSLVSEN